MYMKKYLLPLTLIVIWASCMPYENDSSIEVDLNFSDKALQHIYSLQDKQQTDSLYKYLRHPTATYRYAACMAFASIQDSLALDSLALLTKDKVEKIRSAATYAIGQTRHSKGESILIKSFAQFDSLGQNQRFNASILEAIGKCGSEQQLENLATIRTYQETDTLLLEGQAWGIYRYALRQITSETGTKKMLDHLINPNIPQSVKYIASNYLARAKNIQIDSSEYTFDNYMLQENDPFLRMNLAIILGKTKTETSKKTLVNIFRTEPDYRVKCNIIRALKNYDYFSVRPLIYEALEDKNIHVATTAAQFLKSKGLEVDARDYALKAATESRWQIKALLYEAAMATLPFYATQTKSRLSSELWKRYGETNNNYEKAAILSAIGEFGWNYRRIYEKTFNADIPIIKTAGVGAITKILETPAFDKLFQGSRNRVRREISFYLREAILSKDPAMIALASGAVANPKNNYKRIWADSTFLMMAQENLSLPKEIETYNELQKAIDYIAGNDKVNLKKLDFNHPIDWALIEKLNERSRAIIATEKGSIILELFYKDSPGSVANFIQLANDGFYDGKVIHRVVPNFVVQGGCPRGDGYGGEDYSIRSELNSLKYDNEGYVGMASAGKDTEGTQWFITHSPTPHLDGRYTIFGKVVEGMTIVHELEIGDRIAKVVIK